MIVDSLASVLRSLNNPAVPLSGKHIVQYFQGGSLANSGINVSASTALSQSSVWSAVDIISGDVSALPLALYRRLDRGKEKERSHPAHILMHRKVGAMTSNVWRRRTVAQACLYGNSYSRIHRIGGRPARLELGHPDRVSTYRPDGGASDAIAYHWLDTKGNNIDLPASDVFHVQGLTLDEMGGLSLVTFARNTIGRYLGAEKFTDDFFRNGTVPVGWFRFPNEMSKEAQDRFRDEYHKRLKSGFQAGVLEEGMDWIQTGISARDAMLVEMLQLAPQDIARFFKLPPSKLGLAVGAKANEEQENLNYLNQCLIHWLTGIEYEAWDKLLLESEKTEETGGLYFEFILDNLLRTDSLTRSQVYRLQISSCMLSPNEAREAENRNPYEGGDDFKNPFTTAGEGTDGGGDSPEPDEEEPDSQNTSTDVVRQVVHDKILQLCKRLAAAGEHAAKKPDTYVDVITSMPAKHRAVVIDGMRPIVCLVRRTKDCEVDVEMMADALMQMAVRHFDAAADGNYSQLPAEARKASQRLLSEVGAMTEELMQWHAN